ncbi:hypothetical protein GCM10027596_15800 [Nocardioides korecus]
MTAQEFPKFRLRHAGPEERRSTAVRPPVVPADHEGEPSSSGGRAELLDVVRWRESATGGNLPDMVPSGH